MSKILIGNIEILYDEYDVEEIERIRSIILNNPSLLADKTIVHINDFDSYFKKVAADFLIENSASLSNKDCLPALYIASLSSRNSECGDALTQIGDNLSDGLLHSLVAYKYYEKNNSLDDFIGYLMY